MNGIEKATDVDKVFFKIGTGLLFRLIALETSAKNICETEVVTSDIGARTYLNIIANKPNSVRPKEKVIIQNRRNWVAKMSVKA